MYNEINFNTFSSRNALFRKVKGIAEFDRCWKVNFLRKGKEDEESSIKASINQFINNANELPIPGMCFVCPNLSNPEIKLISYVEAVTGPVVELDLRNRKQIVKFFITMLDINVEEE